MILIHYFEEKHSVQRLILHSSKNPSSETNIADLGNLKQRNLGNEAQVLGFPEKAQWKNPDPLA